MSKSICIVSPSLKIGGIERALVVLTEYFVKQGHKVSFISCLSGDHFYELDPDINLIELDFKHSERSFKKLIFYIKIINALRKAIQKINPDVILTFGDLFSPIVLLSVINLDFPVFISDRTSPDYNFKFPIPQLKRWLYPKSKGFIAQTGRAADYKRQQFSDRLNIAVINNALRKVTLYPEINREKIILYVGRLEWEKGPDRLIEAFAKLNNKNGWKLHMAGSGPLLNKMQILAKGLNIFDKVIFYGKVKDIDALYARAGIYVLPSILEGFPNSLVEAMAAGLPVVCFDSIPWEEIFESGISGLVIKNGDIQGLTNTLQELINNEDLRRLLGQNALSIKDRLSIEKIGNQVLEFILNT